MIIGYRLPSMHQKDMQLNYKSCTWFYTQEFITLVKMTAVVQNVIQPISVLISAILQLSQLDKLNTFMSLWFFVILHSSYITYMNVGANLKTQYNITLMYK